MPKQYFVYILASKKNGTLYIGSTSNLAKRINEHKNSADLKSFTSKYNIKLLVYFEECPDAESMINRERRLKEWNRNWKLRLIHKNNQEWKDLSLDI
jgi:putative endonuclease